MYYFSFVAVAAACFLRLRARKVVYFANSLAQLVGVDREQPVEELVAMLAMLAMLVESGLAGMGPWEHWRRSRHRPHLLVQMYLRCSY